MNSFYHVRTILTASLSAALLLGGCFTQRPYVWIGELPEQGLPVQIQEGDRISVQVKDQLSLSGEFLIRANGAYLQPVVGDVTVAGMTPEDASKHLAKQLKGVVVNPLVSITVSAPRALHITVLGEVRTPGNHELARPEGLLDVLARAGGLTEFAADDGLYVLRKNPQRIRIRVRYSDLTSGTGPSATFTLRDGDIVVAE